MLNKVSVGELIALLIIVLLIGAMIPSVHP